MKNINEIYSEILNEVAKAKPDEYRPWMNEPFIANGRNAATTLHYLVSVPLFDSSLTDQSKKCEFILSQERPSSKEYSITELKEALSKFTMEPIFQTFEKICECCKGYGTVEYEFEYKSKTYTEYCDCPVCGGDGNIEIKNPEPTGNYEYVHGYYVKISGMLFNPNYIQIAVDIAEKLEIKSVKFNYGNKTSGAMFNIGDVELIVMGIADGYQSSHSILAKL